MFGRGEEQRQLDGALTRASEGATTLVAIQGNAGMGKSSLLAHLRQRAIADGFTVLRGVGDEFERTRPFGPLIHAVSSVDTDRHVKAEITQLLGSAPDLATPLVLVAVPDLRHRVIDALCDLVERAALHGPVLLELDDLHLADASTLIAVRSLARRVEGYRLLLAAAARPRETEPEWTSVLDQAHTVIDVAGLRSADRSALVAARIGAPIGPRLRSLAEATAGSPFLLERLIRGLDATTLRTTSDGSLDVEPSFVSVPLRTAIAATVARLTPLSAEVVRAAAVLGSSAQPSEVAAVLATSVPRILGSIEDGIRAGLFASSESSVTFEHDLVRDAVLDTIPHVVRTALHREAARVLMEHDAGAARVATHLEAAGEDGASLREWLERAATDAMGTSPSVARRLLARARETVDRDDPEWVNLGVAELEAAITSGAVAEAEQLGVELSDAPLSEAKRAAVRLWLGSAMFLQQRSNDAADLFDHAATEADPNEAALFLTYASLARLISFAPSVQTSVDRAVAATAHDGDLQSRSLALSIQSRLLGSGARFTDALEPALRSVRLADEDTHVYSHRFQPLWFLALALYDADRLDEAIAAIARGRQRAAATGSAWSEPLYHGLLALIHLTSGRDDEADVEAGAGRAAAEETGSTIAILWAHGITALVAINRRRFDDAETAIAAGEASFATGQGLLGIDLIVLARARLLAAQGRFDDARSHLEQSWTMFASTAVDVSNDALAIDLVDLAVRTGQTGYVPNVLETVRRWVGADPHSPRLRAMALAVGGIASGDPTVVSQAAEAFRAVRRTSNARLLDTIARRLQGLDDRPEAETSSAQPDNDDAVQGWAQLSPAEQRVCLAVGRGLSNKAIAAELFLSTRTVETHVSHILRKMDVPSRLQLGLRVRPLLAAG